MTQKLVIFFLLHVLTFDADIQFQLFIVYLSLHRISHLIMLIVGLYLLLCITQNNAQKIIVIEYVRYKLNMQ